MTVEPANEGTAGSESSAEASVVIRHAVGLHARPSVKLTKLAKTFTASIRLRGEPDKKGGDWVDAKSIVKVMALKVPEGATLVLQAEGADAEDAVAALVALVERDFDEQPGG